MKRLEYSPKRKNVENSEIKKASAINLKKLQVYVPNSVVVKSIVKKNTGSISAFTFDSKKVLKGKVSAFDTFIECIEGKAEVVIDNKTELINKGQFIIIPAHSQNIIKATERFKMLSVIIKSGYEEIR